MFHLMEGECSIIVILANVETMTGKFIELAVQAFDSKVPLKFSKTIFKSNIFAVVRREIINVVSTDNYVNAINFYMYSTAQMYM